ncbi:MAG TPA: DUF3276 family protein [Bacteroidota bacterium]|jgi:hypothetical protein
MTGNNALYSTQVRAGRTTFFVDVKEARNGNKFLAISENKLSPENEYQRTTVRIFGNAILDFSEAINSAVAAASQPQENEPTVEEAVS